MKKLLFLGGARMQSACIRQASDIGITTILCDMNKEPPAKAYATRFYQESTTDLKAILKVAKIEDIDGVIAYASDPAAPTAAYVAEKMGLPGNPYETVRMMTRKDLYRNFLGVNGFNVPKVYSSGVVHLIDYPAIVKPVDSSGSKGVSLVSDSEECNNAITHAMWNSRCEKVIIEQFVKRSGYQLSGDGFVVDGKLVFSCFGNEHFEPGGLVPIGPSFPSIWAPQHLDHVRAEVQKFLDIAGYRTGALNFDIMIDENDKIYLMEIGPRNGGNLLPELTKLATGEDMIDATIKAALGKAPRFSHDGGSVSGFWSCYVIHSMQDGIYKNTVFEDGTQDNVVSREIFVKPGDKVKEFTGSDCSLGTVVMKFSSQREMLTKMDNMRKYIHVELE